MLERSEVRTKRGGIGELQGTLPTAVDAENLLNTFSKYTRYRYGASNPYLAWLRTLSDLDPALVVHFYNFWYPVSRRQPQLLLRCAAAYPDRMDRERIIIGNYLEEDGLVNPGDDSHYDLLEELIAKLGGELSVDAYALRLVDKLHSDLCDLTPAEASGALAAIEHPALDISGYFHETIARSGHSNLLTTDPYLTIHVRVEPAHIVWSHETALQYMRAGHTREVLAGFRRVMAFWLTFWPRAFAKLHYPRTSQRPSASRKRVATQVLVRRLSA